MFKYNFNQITNEEKELVLKCYQKGFSIKKISNVTNLLCNEALYLLCDNKCKIIDPTCLNIKDKKIIIISDTHIGSELDNISYLDKLYNYATVNNINTILHSGDLIQSAINQTRKQLSTAKLQIEYLIEKYPSDKNITNHILLGNHDFHGLKNKTDNWLILNSRKDINILGFNKALINWQNNVISLSHKIKNYYINLPNFESLIYFVGHRHSLKINNRPSIFVPTLSDDLKEYDNEPNFPGFIVAEISNDKLVINHLILQDKIIDKGPILTKSIV